ncbi:hypothetical protein [Saccharibacillus sp. JS10]|uniref:hypothetical protein n=1 Tax=Saccharibacillus sp. JS10 TaxID=2950552 RepID=UPI002109A9E9|nr:hypothetical protein [Saccharibacillus sp. JS10]MCQ4088381.1 hypothetical protein [Saccharibacillus sp. JS10]
MQSLKGLYAMFLQEPLWCKILIIASLGAAVILSNSSFGLYAQVGAKLAAAVFFGIIAIRLRGSRKLFIVLIACVILCVLLAGNLLL